MDIAADRAQPAMTASTVARALAAERRDRAPAHLQSEGEASDGAPKNHSGGLRPRRGAYAPCRNFRAGGVSPERKSALGARCMLWPPWPTQESSGRNWMPVPSASRGWHGTRRSATNLAAPTYHNVPLRHPVRAVIARGGSTARDCERSSMTPSRCRSCQWRRGTGSEGPTVAYCTQCCVVGLARAISIRCLYCTRCDPPPWTPSLLRAIRRSLGQHRGQFGLHTLIAHIDCTH